MISNHGKTAWLEYWFCLLLLQLAPIEELEPIPQTLQSSKNSGVDLTATDVSFSYSNPSDESQYKMFSSNHPIVGFDRPKDLYAVDTVNSTPMDIEVTVRNDGSTASGIITVQLLILHNEYERFELANRTVTMNSLSSSGQGTATFYNVYVNYAGNHTWSLFLHFKASMTIRATTTSIATTPLLISTLPAHHLLVGMQASIGVRVPIHL